MKNYFFSTKDQECPRRSSIKKSEYFGPYILSSLSIVIMELWGVAIYAVALYIVLLRYLCGSHYNFSRTLFISPSTCCLIVLCANSFNAYINGYLIKEGIFNLDPSSFQKNARNHCPSTFHFRYLLFYQNYVENLRDRKLFCTFF